MATYGFTYEDRTYIVNIGPALVVRRIFRSYRFGYGAAAISNQLNLEGVEPPENAKRWYPNTIYNMLRNEKYVGDTRFQKTYREDDLPFTKRKNRGELPSYYVMNTHMGIVDREEWDEVQHLLAFRSQYHATGPATDHAMKSVLHCGCCGGTMKRKMVRGKAYWVCYHHNIRKEYCELPPVSEADIEDAYVVMFNKLQANSKHILTPAIQSLTKLQNSMRQENARLVDIDKRLVELNDKKLLLAKLNARSVMDDKTYASEISVVDADAERLKSERQKMLTSDEDLQQISQLKDIRSFLEGAAQLKEFSGTAFTALVESAVVTDKNHIEFKLFGGLNIPERLGRTD